MDFFSIKQRSTKNGQIEIYPDFKVGRSKDLMIRGKSFYAIWDEEKGLWSTDEYDVQRLVDKELLEYKDRLSKETTNPIFVRSMSDFSTNSWTAFKQYVTHVSDNATSLDLNLVFQNTEVKKKDFVSKRLSYPLEEGPYEAYEELISTLYSPEERLKLEWAIGAIISGDAKDIQKFLVLYGEAGTGKSTVLNIIQKLFDGYYTTFEAKALTSSSNAFATEVFRSNPLVAIQHDGDLSRIEDNTKLNSIASHEYMTMNEKYKPSYSARANCMLIMATNKPVKITDAKSGIIRRLIDVHPTGKKLPVKKYHQLMSRIEFELGAIAFHCLSVYRETGKNYYSDYRPLEMILQTDVFFNFVESNFQIFVEQNGVSLTQAYALYKTYCDEALIEYKMPRHKFREELKSYFETFFEMTRIDGKQVRSYYSGFILSRFTEGTLLKEETDHPSWLVLDSKISLLDDLYSNSPAQYATVKETPRLRWSDVKTSLQDLNTKRLHYVRLPIQHIVIDFDLKDEKGEKSSEKNLEAASKWPPTYAEYSKSQNGVHLHYIYDGDPLKLSSVYADGIEVKVFSGASSLRRKLSFCNTIPVATINSGLPLKSLKGDNVINFEAVQSEKGLRTLIVRNLSKEIHNATKPSIDFINTILNEAYDSGLKYDVTDMRPRILTFAANSTNQAAYCINVVADMKFKSDEPSVSQEVYSSEKLVFFDVEVFPNLLMVNWKWEGDDQVCVHMINPKPPELEDFFKMKLVGFNCRRYDNHILYAAFLGYTNEQIFSLSQKIISDNRNSFFGEAYNISYADVYDFSSEKMSLKKFQIKLGIHHQELGFPWDQPVSEDLWPLVAEYCDNDVMSLEAVFKSRHEDYVARLILSELSGLKVNDTTQAHTAKIIFGSDQNPQDKFVYTDLSELFPGYIFANGKSSYRGEDPGEGGYVYANPGVYENVALLDVASMHPTSIELLNLFGPYTKTFSELKEARLAIKRKDFQSASKLLNGVLEPYLNDEGAKSLSHALKIVINIVYGLTSASFQNKFRDPRNKDNIVAKRGALFMIDLKHAARDRGLLVAHIKTDSIKIPNATKEDIEFIIDFGKKYGYEFEHEATYSKFCLVNDAVYIARYNTGEWTATGAQFAQPYVFKTLFSNEEIVFEDLCETKTVSTALYLNMNEGLEEDDLHFVGKAGEFCPIKAGKGGGILLREKDGKFNAVTGTKGYRWLQAEHVRELQKENDIDLSYYNTMAEKAVAAISEFVDFEAFVSDEPLPPPW